MQTEVLKSNVYIFSWLYEPFCNTTCSHTDHQGTMSWWQALHIILVLLPQPTNTPPMFSTHSKSTAFWTEKVKSAMSSSASSPEPQTVSTTLRYLPMTANYSKEVFSSTFISIFPYFSHKNMTTKNSDAKAHDYP